MGDYLNRIFLSKMALFFFNTAVYWAVVLTFGFGGAGTRSLFRQYTIIYIVMNLSLYSFRNYDLDRFRSLNRMALSVFAGVIVGVMASIPFLLLFFHIRIPKMQMLFVSLVLCAGFFLSHFLFYRFSRFGPQKSRRLVILGDKGRWEDFVGELTEALGKGVEFVSYVDPLQLPRLEPGGGAPPSLVITDYSLFEDDKMRDWLEGKAARGFTVEFAPQLAEDHLDRIPLEVAQAYRHYYEMAFMMAHPAPPQRVFDLVVSTLGLLAAAVISVVIVPAIMIDSGRPIFFTQERVGRDGKPFRIHKFRTMKDRGKAGAAFADDDAKLITSVGAVLRKFRLDELPQLWDVLRGKMSIVGPRPEQPEFVKEYEEKIPFYAYRHRLRPGITGWAQINFGYAGNLEEASRKLEYDLYYVKNRNTLLDIQVLLKTAETILGMRGAK
jgi:exopolysaccharide biosynthesis polyprenyl glycosylphosphotransferase